MSDYALQRLNMVESQVRPSDVIDRRIPRAMLALPRERFVPGNLKSICYMDRDVPLRGEPGNPGGRVLLAPSVQARLIQALEVPDDGVVLDVACGLGYSSALLARIAQSVVAVEEDEEFAAHAMAAFDELEINNVVVMTAPLTAGCETEGPYDGILVNGAVDLMPDGLLDQLKDGGRLVAVMGRGRAARATVWRRAGGQFGSRAVFDADAAHLPGFIAKDAFVF